MAALEEFLQQKYVDLYDEVKDDNKVLSLINNPSTSGYFYEPDKGSLQYIVDSDGHALYLINKSGLPSEIKDNLVGGEAGDGSYADYQRLNDVYGVTTNLKVYYCSEGLDTIIGLAKDDLDLDNPTRVVFPSDSTFADMITGGSGKPVTAQDIKKLTDLEIDGKKVQSLADLYNLTSLERLILKDYNGSMAGIENATQISKIQLESCVISDYSSIGKLGKKLNKLYLYNVDDNEVTKLCDKTLGIGGYDLENLNYFGVVGNKISLDTTAFNGTIQLFDGIKSTKTITKVDSFNNLTEKTKNSVKYLYVNNNQLKDLSGFINYKSVILIRGEYNSLETLNGLQNMSLLQYLLVQSNRLGINEKTEKNEETDALSYLVTDTSLSILDLRSNQIIHIDYIKNLKNISELYLGGNEKFSLSEIPNIASLYLELWGDHKSIDSKYLDYMQTSNNFKYKNLASTDIEKINYLKNLSQTEKDKVKYMDLSGSKIDDTTFKEILTGYNNLEELNCTNCTNLRTLDWMNGKTKLKQFLFENTAISGSEVSKLDTYATALQSFLCNNVNIDLTQMQSTISNAKCFYGKAGYTGYIGAGITNSQLVDKLEQCTNITYLVTNGMVEASDQVLDLTNSKLTDGYFQGGGKIIIPACMHRVTCFFLGSSMIDFRNFKNSPDKKFSFDMGLSAFSIASGELQKWQLQQIIDNELILDSLSVGIRSSSFISYDLLGYLNKINVSKLNLGSISAQENFNFVPTSWTGTLLNLKSIIMTGTTLKNLDFLKNNLQLENISLINCRIDDISGLKCYNTLKNLILSNNQITNLADISKFTHLGENYGGIAGLLDLSSNPIYNTFHYTDENGGIIQNEDGSQKKTENIEELAKLKQHAKNLKTIILLPNEYIIDYGPLEKLGYDKNSGTFK